MTPDNLKKLLDTNVKHFNEINNALDITKNTLQDLVEGGKTLMSTDLKLQNQISAIQKQLDGLESLVKQHLQTH